MDKTKRKLTALILACIAVVVVIALLLANMNGDKKKENINSAGQKIAVQESSVADEAEKEVEEASVSEELQISADSAVSQPEEAQSGSSDWESVQPAEPSENQPVGSQNDGSGQIYPPEGGNTTEIIRDDDEQDGSGQASNPTAEPQPRQPAETPTPEPSDGGRDAYETPIIIDPD